MNCGKCGLPVQWVQIDGRWFCHNAGTDTDHWDVCSQRRYAAIVKTGEFFETAQDAGYLTELKPSGVQYTMHASKVIVGKNYKSVPPCPNGCTPWEECFTCMTK